MKTPQASEILCQITRMTQCPPLAVGFLGNVLTSRGRLLLGVGSQHPLEDQWLVFGRRWAIQIAKRSSIPMS
ncbi:hypothetical protein TNCT_310151 [Trichonephila clavata]|uniref:Uncharacterized protein n=1 Tax=Trichonephila clavata TaxID=2740835 RepID=A0A8X6JAD2_TRICU|nr:hypothetical protein TNCT_310151 [Trichonephila clavata]